MYCAPVGRLKTTEPIETAIYMKNPRVLILNIYFTYVWAQKFFFLRANYSFFLSFFSSQNLLLYEKLTVLKFFIANNRFDSLIS